MIGKMKYKKHYLSDGKNNKLCPLNTNNWTCDSYCVWFDHEEQDCRKILALEDIVYTMREKNARKPMMELRDID